MAAGRSGMEREAGDGKLGCWEGWQQLPGDPRLHMRLPEVQPPLSHGCWPHHFSASVSLCPVSLGVHLFSLSLLVGEM